MTSRLDDRGRMLFAGLVFLMGVAGLSGANAAPITFSGTVDYQGPYSGDSLFVAVLDTSGSEDADIVSLEVYAVGAPPFSQPYSVTFDNAGVSPMVLIASFLDVDGGGVENVSGADVLGWFAGGADPLGVSSSADQSGLDFELPRAEIRGTVTFAPGQTTASLETSASGMCSESGFRPRVEISSEGAYAIVGLYAGTYCVWGDGGGSFGFAQVCYGDPSCANPTLLSLGATEVRTGIDLDFNDVVPAETTTWGELKGRYR